MENNIFIKMKKEKYNPDIENKFKGKECERKATQFDLSTSIYNPITGIVPSQIRSNSDLELDKDDKYSSDDVNKLIIEKKNERGIQDIEYKPIKTKIINNNPQNSSSNLNSNLNSSSSSNLNSSSSSSSNLNSSSSSNINQTTCEQNQKNYIETYEELKRGSNRFKDIHINNNNQNNQNNQKYNDIIDGLKDLGIIK